MNVLRLDQATSAKVTRHEDGSITCDARIARAGVYTYILPTGEVSREYRSPDEVFKQDALQSFELVPLTLNHPASGKVTPENYRMEVRGLVTNVVQDSTSPAYVLATIKIQDADALQAIQDGTVQLSCGYMAERVPVSNMIVTDDLSGERISVNAVLKNIQGNHVAIVDCGRAGPGARLLLDSQPNIGVEVIKLDNVVAETILEPTGLLVTPVVDSMTTTLQVDSIITLNEEKKDCVEVVVSVEKEEPLAPAPVMYTQEELDAALKSLQDKLNELSAALSLALDPNTLDAAILERTIVKEKANTFQVKCDGLSINDIRKAVLTKQFPKLVLDGFTQDQLQSLFDSVVSPVANTVPARTESTVQLSNPVNLLDEARAGQRKLLGMS